MHDDEARGVIDNKAENFGHRSNLIEAGCVRAARRSVAVAQLAEDGRVLQGGGVLGDRFVLGQ